MQEPHALSAERLPLLDQFHRRRFAADQHDLEIVGRVLPPRGLAMAMSIAIHEVRRPARGRQFRHALLPEHGRQVQHADAMSPAVVQNSPAAQFDRRGGQDQGRSAQQRRKDLFAGGVETERDDLQYSVADARYFPGLVALANSVAWLTRLRCSISTPLGRPVEPEV